MTDYVSHQQQDLIAPSHRHPHQPPSKHGHDHHHTNGTYQGKLSSSQLHRGFGPPQYSQPDMDMVGAGMSCRTRRIWNVSLTYFYGSNLGVMCI